MFAIPTRAAEHVAGGCAAFAVIGIERPNALRRIFLRRQILDAPVVRHVERAPFGIIECDRFRARRIRAQEAPTGVERAIAVARSEVSGEKTERTHGREHEQNEVREKTRSAFHADASITIESSARAPSCSRIFPATKR